MKSPLNIIRNLMILSFTLVGLSTMALERILKLKIL